MYFLRWWWSVYRDYLFQWTSSVLLKDVYVNYALTKKVMKKVTNDVFSKYFVKTLTKLFQKIISFCNVIKWNKSVMWLKWYLLSTFTPLLAIYPKYPALRKLEKNHQCTTIEMISKGKVPEWKYRKTVSTIHFIIL